MVLKTFIGVDYTMNRIVVYVGAVFLVLMGMFFMKDMYPISAQTNGTDDQNDAFDTLREKWNENLLGLEAYDEDNSNMKEIITRKTSEATELWETMNKNNDRDFLWEEFSNGSEDPADIRESYRNLYKMAEMFSTEDSSLYHDSELLADITSGLDWLYNNHYNEEIEQYGNWWPWEIGIPQALNNTVSVLYDYLDAEKIENYMDVVDHFQPDPTKSGATTPDRYREAVGANRIDTSKVVAIRGIIVKDGDKIADSRDALSSVFEYVDEEDGFYKDGSFLQHEDIAYTGSYGVVLIEGLTELLNLLSDTDWEVTDSNVENVYDWVGDSFEPLMHKGSLMDMVRGRAISRSFLQDHDSGHTVIQTVLRMSQFAPESYASDFKQMVKYWIQEDDYLDYFDNADNFIDIALAEKLMEDDSIEPRGDMNVHKTYANMDRVVKHGPGYAIGISMYSDRIQNYEDMNDENRKGWYTGSGMTYLYNNDLGQYSDGFWPTVDPYRLPGTTVDTMEREDGSGEQRSSQSWVGGSTLADQYGSTGMYYDAWNSTLEAKKSWFMLDDKMVALGADITSDEDRNIETTVENRKINDDGSNKLIINGEEQEELPMEHEVDKAEWAFLEGKDSESNIGYYFPEPRTLHVKKEERKGAWSDINYTEPDDTIKRNYATMWYDHGVKPDDDTYSYVLLPGKSEEEVGAYAKDPDIDVIRNDGDVQAVADTNEQILGANFWKDEKQTAGSLTSHQKASVTMQESDDALDVSVSDPTMKNDDVIELELDEEALKVIEADERVTVEQLKPSIKITIDVKDAKGQSINIKLKTLSSIKSVKDIIDVLEENIDTEDITDEDTIHALKLHLKSVLHYEEQENDKKVVKHLKGFNQLIEDKEQDNLISEKAYSELKASTDVLIDERQ